MKMGAVIGAIVTGAVASASPGALAQAPEEDSVTGSAYQCAVPDCYYTPSWVIVEARAGAGGENPTGTVTWGRRDHSGTYVWSGGVGCLSVHGNVAIISSNAIYGSGLINGSIRVTDGGVGPGKDSYSFVTREYLPGTPPLPSPDCSSFPGTAPPTPYVQTDQGTNDEGDLTVHDAVRLPTTKDECRRGGWITFGFSSHAACTASVLEHARQACIFERVAHGITAFRAKYGLEPNHDHAMRHCVRLYIGF